jgi:hypothetical protein
MPGVLITTVASSGVRGGVITYFYGTRVGKRGKHVGFVAKQVEAVALVAIIQRGGISL